MQSHCESCVHCSNPISASASHEDAASQLWAERNAHDEPPPSSLLQRVRLPYPHDDLDYLHDLVPKNGLPYAAPAVVTLQYDLIAITGSEAGVRLINAQQQQPYR